MTTGSEDWRADFEQALGETFGEFVSPPVPFEDASPHECCEVVWEVAGRDVTPARLAALTEAEVAALARRFGEYFESEAPTVEQVEDAIAQTLRGGLSGPSVSRRNSARHLTASPRSFRAG